MLGRKLNKTLSAGGQHAQGSIPTFSMVKRVPMAIVTDNILYESRVPPARAGIDLPMVKRLLAHERFPRTRGDRPERAKVEACRGRIWVPPHARG